MANIFLLDNLGSFTYNLVDQLKKNNHYVLVYRNNNKISNIINEINKIHKPIVLLSPGPGIPYKAGCMLELLKNFIGLVPIIGICLGYQAIIEIYGGKIKQANKILHGRNSLIYHDNKDMFYKISNPLLVSRYHSLIGINIPKNLTVNAFYYDIVMSVRNNLDKVCGFQFHPESILTTMGDKLLNNTIKWAMFK